MRLKLKGKTLLVEIPTPTPILDAECANVRWASEANELWLRWYENRDLTALNELLCRKHPPYDLAETLQGALDQYLHKGVDLAVALAAGAGAPFGRHAQPRTRYYEHERIESVYLAVLASTAAGWSGPERFHQADRLLARLRSDVNGYPEGHRQRLPYIRRLYHRRKRAVRVLRFEHREVLTILLGLLPKGPHHGGNRWEYDAEAGAHRIFVSRFDERTERWHETGDSFLVGLRPRSSPTKKRSRLRTLKKRSS